MTNLEKIKQILSGIDKTEMEGGWWETSDYAKFGAEKLAQIDKVLADEVPQYYSVKCSKCGANQDDIKNHEEYIGWVFRDAWFCPNCR